MTEIKDSPTVSVIIPTYNKAHLVGRAIQSVLCQTYQDLELIVVNDGSTDNTEEVIKSFNDDRLRYIRLSEGSGGSAVPRNTGLKAAKGEYIASLDDDYFWLDRDKLKKQVEFLDAHPDYVLVGTNTVVVDENGTELARSFLPERDEEIRGRLLEQNCFVHGSAVYKKSAVMIFGGYSFVKGLHYSHYSNDYELWLKLGTVGKFINLPIYGVSYTASSRSISAKNGMILCLNDIKLIGKFKDKYPNYWRAIGFRSVGVFETLLLAVLSFPPLLAWQNLLKRRFPAFWRVISACYRTIRQGILSVLTGFHRQ